MPPHRQWVLAPLAPRELFIQLPQIPAPLVQVLYNRGLRGTQEISGFFQAGQDGGNPFRLKGMHQAVARIRQALKAGEPIAVYGDFDADGLAGVAILVETLRSLGGRAIPYIPQRISEGYGLNHQALEGLARQQGVKLAVTVDCGIRSREEVAQAKAMGMEVIITDHHSLPRELPLASAIVNPKQADCPYPFKELSGAALAYRLAQALLRVQAQAPIGRRRAELEEESLLDLVALGTVADLVPLAGENRELVRQGLARLNGGPRPGLQALLNQARLTAGAITSQAVAFRLAPRLNAAGRLDRSEVALDLLLTRDPGRAAALAMELEGLNRERQALTESLTARALEEVEARHLEEDSFLFLAGAEYFSGVNGLVAARLVEAYYRPALVLEAGEEFSRGSARSIPEFSVIGALEACSAHLTRYGGHALAAGVTLPNAQVATLGERLRAIAEEELAGKSLVPKVAIDAELPLKELSPQFYPALEGLAPFGHANPEPLFLARAVPVREARRVGNGHLKLSLEAAPVVWSAIAYGQGEWSEKLPSHIDLVYSLQKDEWQGEPRLELRVEDLRPAQSPS